MHKVGADPKVKKTLVRNYERKARPPAGKQVVRNESSPDITPSTAKHTDLSEPILCSSTALANYLSDIKNAAPPSKNEDLNVDEGEVYAKMTRKLNFHINDRVYKNLIELNATLEDHKTKKDRRPPSTSSKKDLEPEIEDFCEFEKEEDFPPKIPTVKPKMKPIKTVEDGSLHKLIASFEGL